MSGIPYSSRIVGVRFSLGNSETAVADSFVQITSHELFKNNTPYPTGPCSALLGTTDHAYKCQTCFNSKKLCMGHPGHIHLNYPVWNPPGFVELRKWLKIICFNCGHPFMPESTYLRLRADKRLDLVAKNAKSYTKPCVHCGAVHPNIRKVKKEPLTMLLEYPDSGPYDMERLLPHKAAEILERVSDATVMALGRPIASHPRSLVIRDIPAPTSVIRPEVRKIGGGKSTNDDLTSMMQVIIKLNEMMPTVIPQAIDKKLEASIVDLCNAYYDFVKAGNEGTVVSLALRLKGKEGRFRKNLMGKRVRMMCRSTIAGNPRIRINEVGVPLIFAQTMQYKEIVQEFNKKRILGYIQNGRDGKYPGASTIVKKNGTRYDVKTEREIELEVGDQVWRDMIDGDPVNFNRQPSLAISAISTNRAKVFRTPHIKTLMMNVLACALYNADFDGDAMNLAINSDIATRHEVSEMSSVANWLISHTNGSPLLGQADDSVIGSAELTRTGVQYDKYHAMLLFKDTTVLPSFDEVGPEGISGRDCVSKLLQATPINFSRVPMWYDPNKAPYIPYDPTETRVRIDQGRLISGVLDKKSIGKGAVGGIYHLICNEYGAEKALDIMFDMQQLAIGHILQAGFTIGLLDLSVPDETRTEIEMVASDIINKSLLITEELINGDIIPPIGKTVSQFFEERQINTLSIFDDFTESIIKAIKPDSNNLFKLIQFGSKGKIDNMFNMVSAIGQKLINGERIRQKFGFKRTLAYFSRFDNSPEARGYITNSYLTGMTTCEYIFNAMAARFDLISKALSTSVTGEQNRKSIKNLESILVNNFRWSVKNQKVIQYIYAEDGLDPRKLERVSFPTVMISDADFEAKYRHESYPEFYEQMRADRAEYRRLFLRVEQSNVKELMSADRTVAVDVQRAVSDVLRTYVDSLAEPSAADLAKMVRTVESLCEDIPYVMINEIQERAKMRIPEHLRAACWLLTMLIRSHLHPRALADGRITAPILQIIIDRIRVRFAKALIEPGTAVGIIAAQSFSEPLTQYMLDAHHRSASGGTSNTSMNKAREILGARDTTKTGTASMLIPLLPEYAVDQAKAQEIANNIEVMKLSQFLVIGRIFFEKYGAPTHPDFEAESAMFKDFTRANPLLIAPGDLVRWCIHFTLNRTALILKNMALETIIARLREYYPDAFFVYTPENASVIVVRVYMRAGMFRGAVTQSAVEAIQQEMADTTIRGVDGITNARVVQLVRNKVSENGAIVRDEANWGIITNGTNMRGILMNRYVDKYRVITDSIQEIRALLGVEAARMRISSALRDFEVCNYRHYMIYADEMTNNGNVTSVESAGLKQRENSNVLLRMGFSSPLATMEEAAIGAMKDQVSGVTAPLLVGSIPRHGTFYNAFHVDTAFVKKHMKKPDDLIDSLYEI